MQHFNIFLQVMRVILQDPTFKVIKIEFVPIFNFVCPQPIDIIREISLNVLPDEDPFDHMATEDPQLDLVL